MTYWLRATDRYVLLSGARGSVAELAPGQAVAYDGSPQHDAAVAEMKVGHEHPLELLEADHDPSLPAPEPDETERQRVDEHEHAERRRQSHEQRLAAEIPSPPAPAAIDGASPTPTTQEARSA